MMKVIFAFLLMLSMVATSEAVVTREWIRFHDTEEPGHNTLRKLARDPAGNIYMVGESPRFYGVDIVKYSPTGAVVWSRYYSTNSTSDRINAVQVDSLGNLYLVGYMHPGSASPDVLVVKYSPAGTLVWRRIVDLSGSTDTAEAAVIGSNGGITLVAKIGSSSDLMLMSYRPDGVLSWQKRVEVGAPQHGNFFMFTDQNKNIVTMTTPLWSPYTERLWAHKCDSAGNPVWTKVYSPPRQELRCNEAKMDAEGGVVFLGYIEEIYQPDKAVLGRLSPSGEVSWQVTYAASSSFDSWGMALAIDPSGNAFAFCRISKPENSFGTALLKVSRNGSLLWSRELPQERLALDGAETDSDGNVYAIGGQFMGGHWSLATAKYLGDGEQAWIDNYSDDNNGTSGSRELLVQQNGDVYVGGAAQPGVYASKALVIKYRQALLVGLEAPLSLVGGEIASGLARLSSAAPSAGVKIHLQSGSSAIQVPSFVTIPAGQTVGSFAISTTPVTTTVTRSFEANLQGRSLQRSISLSPGGLSSLSLNPANVTSGANSTGTIRLTGPAPSGGVSVSLTYNSGVLSGPASVTVPSGQESGSFEVQTSYVSSRVTRSITATRGAVSRIANITIAPAYDLVVNPSTVQSGQNTTARVTIPNAAPSGGLSIPVTSSSSALAVPQSVTIPAGEFSALFTVGTRPVSATVGRYITVTYNGLNKSALVTITPYSNLATLTVSPSTVKGGTSTTGTVTLDLAAPSDGAVVNLSSSTSYITVPASVNVPAGQTSVSFTITTKAVGATFTRSISASRNGMTRTANITLTP